MKNEPVTVATYACAMEANAVRKLLERNGITAVVADEYLSDQRYSTLARVKLQVLGSDAARARDLLDSAAHAVEY